MLHSVADRAYGVLVMLHAATDSTDITATTDAVTNLFWSRASAHEGLQFHQQP
jgi:hypothetical protein